MGHVVGTAGHIDHGKSTLIHRLTGIDPDRLAEEKRRGMTIDLGFAHLRLPSGREVGIVDVPGHARFIRNMLAGAHGLDAVLLVVAADEGVMPQTVEHLEILDLLGIERALVVLTKSDLVDAEWLAMVGGQVGERLAGTALEGARQVAVSAATGAGMDELRDALEEILASAPPRPGSGRARLPIDRVFTMAGFGTVATGTLGGGSISVGDDLEVVPGGRRVRVRGVQQHGRTVAAAEPGSRVAVNLAGIEKADLGRGQCLVTPGSLGESRRLDVQVRVLASSPWPLRHGSAVMVHAGTAEVAARAIVLAGDSIAPGATGWVQLWLAGPLAAQGGDRLVLRLPSPPATIAGGVIADAAPHRHPRGDTAVVEALDRRLAGDQLRDELRKYPRGVLAAALLRATLAEAPDLAGLDAVRAGDWLFDADAWRALAERAGTLLAAHHRAHAMRPGMPREELRSKLGIAPPAFPAVVGRLLADGLVVEAGADLALPGHSASAERQAHEDGPGRALLELLAASPFSPPSLPEAMREAGAGEEVLRALGRSGLLVRLGPDLAFTRAAYDRALDAVREIVAVEGGVTVARLRDALGGSRRPLVAFLEHLDAERITRRQGDVRTLRAPLR